MSTKTRPFESGRATQFGRRDGCTADGKKCFTGDTELMGEETK